MERLLDVFALLSIALLLTVLRSLRREHIRVEHSVSWLVAGVAVLALSRCHEALDRLSGWLGLSDPGFVLVLIVLVVSLTVSYRYSRIVSELKDMNITLTQRVAILEYRVRSLDEERKKSR
jgi:hypothetical protein